MKVVVDAGRCSAAGMCISVAPALFDLRGEDGVAVVLVDAVPPEREDDARSAVTCCPVEAISIEDGS